MFLFSEKVLEMKQLSNRNKEVSFTQLSNFSSIHLFFN